MSSCVVVGAILLASVGDEARCFRVEGEPELVAGLVETATTATGREACERIEITRTPEGQLRLTRRQEQRTVADLGTAQAIVASWRQRSLPKANVQSNPAQTSAPGTSYRLSLGATVGVDDRGEVWRGLELGGDLVLNDWRLGASATLSSGGDWQKLESSGGWAARDFQLLLGLGHQFRVGPLSLTPRVSAGWAHHEFEGDWGRGEEDQLRAEAELGVGWSLGLLGFELIVAGGPFTGRRVDPYLLQVGLIRSEYPAVDAAWRGRLLLSVALTPMGAP